MVVFRNLDVAKQEMAHLAKKLHDVVFMTYTVYGNNPRTLEFNLCTRAELVGGRATTRLMYQYSPVVGMVEFNSIEEIEEELGEKVRSNVIPLHHCGDMAMRGASSSLEEVYFGTNN